MKHFLLSCSALLACLFTVFDTSAQIWSDDFSNPANWVVGHTPGTQGDWAIGTSALNFVGVLNSTSGGNFAGFDSDALGQGTTNDAWVQTANPINLSSYAQVTLSFEQAYQRFQDNTYVEVSTNGTIWTAFQVNTTIGVNQSTPNPDFQSLDISSVAGNQPAVWIRFRYQGAWDYAWAVDDITLDAPQQRPGARHGVLQYFGPAGRYDLLLDDSASACGFRHH